jgi:hypothetical protein
MKQKETKDASELFYSFFSQIKPHQRKDTSTGDEWRSHVLPHSGIEELAPNLWHVTGTLPSSTMVPREMVLYRLADSSLLIHSAIALDEQAMAQLESLGTPKILIVPNRIHRLDASVYKQRYPQLIVVCPAAAKQYVEEVVAVDGIAEEVLPAYKIICHEPAGIRPQELVYELPLPTGIALVFTDILFNLNKSYLQQHLSKGEFILQWLGASVIGSSGFFGITGLGKRVFLRDRNAYRQWLEALAANVPELRVICVAHGSPIITNCTQRLREAAARLL